MATLRTVAAAPMSKGVISAGWYSILTGLALLFVAYALSSAGDTDPAAPYLAVLLAVTGVWQLGRGVRLQVQRKSVR
jgi:DMSO reductase anchor subunit